MPGQPIAGAPHALIDGKGKRTATRYERSVILRRRRAIAEAPEPRNISVPSGSTFESSHGLQINTHIGRSVRHHLDCGCPCLIPVQLDSYRARSDALILQHQRCRSGTASVQRHVRSRRLGGDDERTSK